MHSLHAVERHIMSRLFYSVYGTVQRATLVKAKNFRHPLLKLIFKCFCIVTQMDLIVDSPDGTVSSLDVINASADLEKRMNITHAEEIIKRLIKDKWMSEVSLEMLI